MSSISEPQTLPRLRLDAETHTYYLDDVEIPGVTKVLTDLGLLSTEWVTPEALYRGRYVHAVLHYLNEGDYHINDCLPQYRGFVDSWLKFRERMGYRMKIIRSEYMLHHEFSRYAGTIDLECLIDHWEWVIDFKTVGRGFHAPKAARFQTGAYDLMLPWYHHEDIPSPRKRGCLELQENGSMANLVPHDDFDDGAHFLCMLDTYNQRRLYGIKHVAY